MRKVLLTENQTRQNYFTMQTNYEPVFEMDEDGEWVEVIAVKPYYDPEEDESNYDNEGNYISQ